jgi:hypothetical protein
MILADESRLPQSGALVHKETVSQLSFRADGEKSFFVCA